MKVERKVPAQVQLSQLSQRRKGRWRLRGREGEWRRYSHFGRSASGGLLGKDRERAYEVPVAVSMKLESEIERDAKEVGTP